MSPTVQMNGVVKVWTSPLESPGVLIEMQIPECLSRSACFKGIEVRKRTVKFAFLTNAPGNSYTSEV